MGLGYELGYGLVRRDRHACRRSGRPGYRCPCVQAPKSVTRISAQTRSTSWLRGNEPISQMHRGRRLTRWPSTVNRSAGRLTSMLASAPQRRVNQQDSVRNSARDRWISGSFPPPSPLCRHAPHSMRLRGCASQRHGDRQKSYFA